MIVLPLPESSGSLQAVWKLVVDGLWLTCPGARAGKLEGTRHVPLLAVDDADRKLSFRSAPDSESKERNQDILAYINFVYIL